MQATGPFQAGMGSGRNRLFLHTPFGVLGQDFAALGTTQDPDRVFFSQEFLQKVHKPPSSFTLILTQTPPEEFNKGQGKKPWIPFPSGSVCGVSRGGSDKLLLAL